MEENSLALPHTFAERKGLVTLKFLFQNSKNFATGSLHSLITGYNQINNGQHLLATCTMTPSWSKLQHGFLPLHLAIRPWRSYRKDIVNSQQIPATYTCGLFTATTPPNNYLLHIPLELKSVSSVTRPFLSAKGRQRQTRKKNAR